MISFTTSQPVHWPPAASPAVAPVAVITGVTPTRAMSRDTQTGTHTGGRDGQAHGPRAGNDKTASESTAQASAKAAPLLPRESVERSRESAPSNQTDAAEKAQRLEAETQAQEKAAQKLQFQEVLSNVWKASAAVVDVVLGREQQLKAAASVDSAGHVVPSGAVPPAATETGPTQSTGKLAPVAETNLEAAVLPGEGRPGQEPVAYTVQGTSSWAPLEAGSLISRRV